MDKKTIATLAGWLIAGYVLAAGLAAMFGYLGGIETIDSVSPKSHEANPSRISQESQINKSELPKSTEETQLRKMVSRMMDGIFHLSNLEGAKIDIDVAWIHWSNQHLGNQVPDIVEVPDDRMEPDSEFYSEMSDTELGNYDMGDLDFVDIHEYSIQSGDSWWKIAQKEYGSGWKSEILARYNSMTINTRLTRGMTIMIPTRECINQLNESYKRVDGEV